MKGFKPEDHMMDLNIMCYKTTVLNHMKTELAQHRHPRFNTTKGERRAIKTLKKNQDIVIKPADKGGAIVIQDLTDYIKEGECQLMKKEHYSPLEDPKKTIKQFIQEVHSTLQQAKTKELIDEDMFKILFRSNPRISNLYLLPKIHKENNPGRPIINSVGSLTFVDEILSKYSKLASSYVKDRTHFLELTMDLNVQESDLLCTVDVTALYTDIPHEDGIEKVTKYLRRHGATEAEIDLTQSLLEHILKKNYFEFKNKIYLQTSGTAMGTRCAPNFAIIFMAELEEQYLTSQTLTPKIWKRYIDDIFMVWSRGHEALNKFIKDLNNFHDTIKFTVEINEYGLPFLDTFIYKVNKLLTKVYHKPTDTYYTPAAIQETKKTQSHTAFWFEPKEFVQKTQIFTQKHEPLSKYFEEENTQNPSSEKQSTESWKSTDLIY